MTGITDNNTLHNHPLQKTNKWTLLWFLIYLSYWFNSGLEDTWHFCSSSFWLWMISTVNVRPLHSLQHSQHEKMRDARFQSKRQHNSPVLMPKMLRNIISHKIFVFSLLWCHKSQLPELWIQRCYLSGDRFWAGLGLSFCSPITAYWKWASDGHSSHTKFSFSINMTNILDFCFLQLALLQSQNGDYMLQYSM